jgi:hypothetical protein
MVANQLLSYADIRDIALLENVPDNKVTIGIWAALQGYTKKSMRKRNKMKVFYYATA